MLIANRTFCRFYIDVIEVLGILVVPSLQYQQQILKLKSLVVRIIIILKITFVQVLILAVCNCSNTTYIAIATSLGASLVWSYVRSQGCPECSSCIKHAWVSVQVAYRNSPQLASPSGVVCRVRGWVQCPMGSLLGSWLGTRISTRCVQSALSFYAHNRDFHLPSPSPFL